MAVNIGPKIGIEGEAEYRKQINSIIQQSKTLASQMKALTTSFDKNNKSLSDNAKQHKLLQEQIKVQEQKVQELNRMLSESSQKFGENSDKTLKWKQSVNEAEAELNRLKGELSSLPSSLDMVSARMEAMGQKLESIGNSIAGFGQKLTAAVTVPIIGLATKAATSFAEVDKTMQLTNATMGNTAAEAKLLDDAMKQAAANSVFGMSDAATATLNFARAGLDATQAANALAPAMNLAAAEGGTLEVVSAGLVGTINGFGDSFDQAEHYADVFTRACNNSALEIDTLCESMGVAAPVFKTAGKSIEDAALLLGIMADNDIDANVAANSLKTGMARLASPTKQAADAMEAYGIAMADVWNEDGSMKDMLTIQRNLNKAFAELSEQEQMSAAAAIFGKNQMAPWLALINTAPKKVEELSAALDDGSVSAKSMAEAMMEGFGGSIEKLKSSLDVAMVSFGQLLAQYLKPVIAKVQVLVDKFNDMSDEEKMQIVRIAAMAAAAGPLLMIGGKLIAGIGKFIQLAKYLPTIMSAFKGVGVVIGGISAPVLAVVAAIGVLVAAFATLWKNNEEFRNSMTATWDGMKASFEGFIAAIQERMPAIQEAFNNVISVVKPLWEAYCNMLAPTFQAAFDTIKLILDALFNAIVSVIDMITGLLTGNKELFMQGLTTFLTTIWTAITTWWTIFWTWVINTANVVLGFFGTSVEQIITTIKNFLINLGKIITEKATEIVDWVTEKINDICDFIASLPEKFYNWGVEMIENLAQGIKDTIGAVKDAIVSVAEAIAEHIHFSEPDKGPLSNFNSWMPDMMKQMAEQIEGGRYQVQAAIGHVAADIAAPMAGARTVTMNNNFTFSGGYTEADGRDIVRKINRQLGALYI